MYEGLAQGFRDATKVLGQVWIDDTTQEIVQVVERNGEKLWMNRVARVAVIEAAAIEFIQAEHYKEGKRIIDQILGNVNWDKFFPTPILPDGSVVSRARPDDIKRERGVAWI